MQIHGADAMVEFERCLAVFLGIAKRRARHGSAAMSSQATSGAHPDSTSSIPLAVALRWTIALARRNICAGSFMRGQLVRRSAFNSLLLLVGRCCHAASIRGNFSPCSGFTLYSR
jgi:hypothetical protein